MPGGTENASVDWINASLERSAESVRTVLDFVSIICQRIPVSGGIPEVRYEYVIV